MNYIESSELNLQHVAIIRPNNDIRYCYLIKDNYVNIMTGLTEDVYEDVVGILPVGISSEVVRVTASYPVEKMKELRLNNGQYFRFSGKHNSFTTSYHIFVYDWCNYSLFGESYWDVDVLLKKFEGYTTIDLVDVSYKIKNNWKENRED